MKAAVTVELDGATFVLDEGAFHALRSYLDRAAARLANHPDKAEVLAGLESSIAEKLGEGPAAQGAPLDRDEMLAGLKLVGRVDGPELAESGAEPKRSAEHGASAGARSASRGAGFGAGPSSCRPAGSTGPSGAHASARPRARRLYRLREGQQIAGVCTGLSAFSEIDVGMIRLLFLLGALFSGGVLLVGYVAMMFVMPLARTEAEIAEARGGLPAG
jgi:phage shock protein C